MQDYGVADDCDYAYTNVHFEVTVSFIDDLREKQHAMKVMMLQLSEDPEEKLAKIKPEKLAKTTIGRIDVSYIIGKKPKYSES